VGVRVMLQAAVVAVPQRELAESLDCTRHPSCVATRARSNRWLKVKRAILPHFSHVRLSIDRVENSDRKNSRRGRKPAMSAFNFELPESSAKSRSGPQGDITERFSYKRRSAKATMIRAGQPS
jgi:hypothetical protein